MQKRIWTLALMLISTSTWAGLSCPPGTDSACLDNGDKVCPPSTRCVAEDVICLDKNSCDPEDSFMCKSDYELVLKDYENAVSEQNKLASENVDLREERLDRKNCVINAATLEAATSCVR
jgi:hypothetical protein